MTTTVPVSLRPPSAPRTFDSAARATLKVKRVGIYLRVSTKRQVLGYGLEVQLAGIQDYLDKKKILDPETIWEVVDVYEDAGESGAEQSRPEIMRLERDARDKKIDVVAVHKFDRIGRTGRAFWYWVWAIEDAGVSIVSVTQEIDTTTNRGIVALQQLASFSEMEWRTILERTQGGLNMKAATGGWTGGPPPYGYCIENKGSRNSKLAVDPDETAVLELAAKLIVEGGYNADRAAHMLNLIGKYTRNGAPWTGHNLRHKFQNNALDGFVVFRNTDEVINRRRRRATKMGEDGKPKHGPTVIIDTPMALSMERLHSVRAALKRNGWRLEGPCKHHPLSTRIIGTCGKHYTGVWVKAEQRRTYRCSGGAGCGDSVIDAVTMEKAVWDSLTEFFGSKEKLRDLAKTWQGEAPDYHHVHEERIAEPGKEIATFNLKALGERQKVEVMELADIKIVLQGKVPPPRRGPVCPVQDWFDSRGAQPRELTEELWEKVAQNLPPIRVIKTTLDPRIVVETALHKVRTSCGWDSLPEGSPNPHTVRTRVRDWMKSGAWDRMMEPLLEPAMRPAGASLPPFEVTGSIDPGLYKFDGPALRHLTGQAADAERQDRQGPAARADRAVRA